MRPKISDDNIEIATRKVPPARAHRLRIAFTCDIGMPFTNYRVFLASPGDLQTERQLVHEILAEFSRRPGSAEIHFSDVGYERTSRGLGNAEERILSELRGCDFLILLLGARWGMPPGGAGAYTSGTEAEFYEAVKCYNSESSPMRGIAVFFRALSPQLVADPGPQLQRVLDFRKHLESTQEIFFGGFDELSSLRSRIETQLSAWVTEIVAAPTKRIEKPINIARPTRGHPDGSAGSAVSAEIIDEHLRAGRFTEAEMVLAHMAADETDLAAMIRYGRFQRNQGRFAQAVGMFTRVFELAELQQNAELQALALDNHARVLRRKGLLQAAEDLHNRAIQLYAAIGGETGALGVGQQHGQLGLIFRLQGEFDRAIESHETAEKIFLKHLSVSDLAIQQGAKGRVYQDRAEKVLAQEDAESAQRDLCVAEGLFRKSLDAAVELGRTIDIAINHGHLTRNYLVQGDLQKASATLAKSLEFNQHAGDKWGVAVCTLYQGWLDLRRGNRLAARTYLSQAVDAFMRMGVKRDLEDARKLLAEIAPGSDV